MLNMNRWYIFVPLLSACIFSASAHQEIKGSQAQNVDLMREKVTELSETIQKMAAIQHTEEDSNQSLRQEVTQQFLNLSNTFKELMMKQGNISQDLTKYRLQVNLFFETTQPVLGRMLISAVENRDQQRVRALLELGAPIEFKDSENNRPIHKASANCDSEILKILLDHGATTNSRGYDDFTPLHWSSYNGYVECARILLERKVSVDSQDGWNRTALIKASGEGHDDLVKLLLKNGADINAVDSMYYHALHWASTYGRYSTVIILVQNGADVLSKTLFGHTASDIAAVENHRDIERFLRNEMNKVYRKI